MFLLAFFFWGEKFFFVPFNFLVFFFFRFNIFIFCCKLDTFSCFILFFFFFFFLDLLLFYFPHVAM